MTPLTALTALTSRCPAEKSVWHLKAAHRERQIVAFVRDRHSRNTQPFCRRAGRDFQARGQVVRPRTGTGRDPGPQSINRARLCNQPRHHRKQLLLQPAGITTVGCRKDMSCVQGGFCNASGRTRTRKLGTRCVAQMKTSPAKANK